MKRVICLLAILLLTLAGCGEEIAPEATLPTQPKTVAVDREELVDGKTLVIHAQVEVPDLDSLEEITLVFDEEKLTAMAEDLVLPQYPEVREQRDELTGSRGWNAETEERLLISLDGTDQGFEAGWVGFLDATRDRNGNGMGEDDLNAFTYGYMTTHIPTGLELTGEEAGEAMGEFLHSYSCFSYKPWSLQTQDAAGGGYYQAFLEPQYDGLPVKGDGPLMVSACLSEEGVFSFQGVLALKEQSRETVEVSVTLEQALDCFREELPYIPGTTVEVLDIRPGYLARSGYQGQWRLRPAWLFTCADHNTLAIPMAGGNPMEVPF